MVEPLARTVGRSASIVTGSINSEYKTLDLWNSLSCEHCSTEWLVYSCQNCEECHCKKCKDLHKRVSISESEESPTSSTNIKDLRASKVGSLCARLPDDRKKCWITGIAVLDGNILVISDFENRKVKLFSTSVSSLSLKFRPMDITAIRENQVAVTLSGRQIALVDVSKGDQPMLTLNKILRVGFDVYGIAAYSEKLIVTSISSINLYSKPCIKMIDTYGKLYWSVSTSSKHVFKLPLYVCISKHAISPTVIITDCGNSTVTLLNASSGEILKQIGLPWSKEPQCVTTDDNNNIYITYIGTHELVVMNEDLSEASVLLSRRGIIGRWFHDETSCVELGGRPWAVAYDPHDKKLIVSYDSRNYLDYFKVIKPL